MIRTAAVFGLIIALIILLISIRKYTLLYEGTSQDWMLLGLVLIGVGAGVFLAHSRKARTSTPKTVSPLKSRAEYGISKREYEVLLLIAKGKSNLEIARELFISESTVKSHVSNLLDKLKVKRRTQAVHKAREKHLIP